MSEGLVVLLFELFGFSEDTPVQMSETLSASVA